MRVYGLRDNNTGDWTRLTELADGSVVPEKEANFFDACEFDNVLTFRDMLLDQQLRDIVEDSKPPEVPEPAGFFEQGDDFGEGWK